MTSVVSATNRLVRLGGLVLHLVSRIVPPLRGKSQTPSATSRVSPFSASSLITGRY
jgi:hypothetical protein